VDGLPRADLREFAPGLSRSCRELVDRERAHAEALVAGGEGGAAVSVRLARAYDGLLQSLWLAAAGVVRRTGRPIRCALLALGGYGRGRLALHSDVDLLVLADGSAGAQDAEADAHAMAEAILYPLWDAGIEVGHAVRTIDETLALATSDLKTATTLLDARGVAGDVRLASGLRDRAPSVLGGPGLGAFLEGLRADAASRHERFGGELHLLEPEVKSGRGGLRDLGVAVWAARVARRAEDLGDLRAVGLLSQREWESAAAADEFLLRVRNLLHARAGRRSDRLTFEDQVEIASRLGFGSSEEEAVPAFMQAYYRHADAIARTSERVLERSEPAGPRRAPVVREIGGGLGLRDDAVSVVDADVFGRDPPALVRLFRVAAERAAPITAFARDLATQAAADPEIFEAIRRSPEAGAEFMALLGIAAAPPGAPALAQMHAAGVLAALLPEFAPLTGLVQHDVYHVYTVDVHSIRAVARLHEIRRGEWSDRLPFATRLAGEIARPDLLALGVLLHDVGKGRGSDHSRRGADMAEAIARRLGLCDPDREDLVFLVLEHLALYKAAMQRDVEDPALVMEVERRVGTPERLAMLHLLTLSDLGTTGPTVLTEWKASMLDDLVRRVRALFEGRTYGRRGDAVRAGVLASWPGGEGAEARSVVATLPDEYLARYDVATVVRHLGAVAGARRGVRVRAWPMGPGDAAAEIVVSAPDRAGLLALVACALAASRLDVVSAGIFSRSDDVALDVFRVRGAEGLAARLGAVAERVERDLDDLLAGRTSADDLLARSRPRSPIREHRLPKVVTKVEVDLEASDAFAVVDVYTRDRPGVLYRIARALGEAGLSVARSRVATEGHRVTDSFYVTDVDGSKLVDPARIEDLQDRIKAALAQVEA